MDSKLFRKWKVTLELKTPFHVGTGNELLNGIDFVYRREDDSIYIPNINELIGIGDIDLQKFEEPALILKDKNLWNNEKYIKRKIEVVKSCGNSRIGRIREHIRDGTGKPYIPGSSIKGVMRTALLWNAATIETDDEKVELKKEYASILDKLLNNRERKSSSKGVDKEIIKKAFIGRSDKKDDAKYDILKTLRISDCYPKSPTTKIYRVAIWDINNRDKYGWWVFRKGPIAKNPCNGTSIFIEAIPPGTKAEFYVSIDKNLIKKHRKHHGWGDEQVSLLKNNILNRLFLYHDQKIKEEGEFFNKFRFYEAVEFYHDLFQKHDKLPENELFIRIGWGGGWIFMTGNWIPHEELNAVRKEFKLGKKIICPCCKKSEAVVIDKMDKTKFYCKRCKKSFTPPNFPKTRRFAMMENNEVKPLGWAKMTWEEI